jgi:16S rRNA (cytosine967-C5)-methyltransferase
LVKSSAASTAPAGVIARLAAAQALYRVRSQGQSLTRVLARPHPALPVSEQALVQEMVYGALRVLPRLDALLKRLLNRPLKPSDHDVEALILIGLYQLLAMNTAAHAAVSVTVEACRLLGKPALAALVNALLRRFLRERETLLTEIELEPAARWLFPDWLLARVQTDWPADWEQIIDASNARPPMALRINRLCIAPADYLAQLTAADIAAQHIPDCDAGVLLEQPRPTRDLPGFAEGWVSVQDSGAQLAAQWLDAQPGHRVLDACAAPGGKTAAMLERADNALNLIAIDSDATRLATVNTTLARLGLTAQVLVADAAAPAGEWCAQPFERILLDVPCSGTGVIRRHPDIKWLRRERDIPALCATQAQMLDAIWPLLARGGRLLYATCSLLAAENQQQIAAFLARTADARELPLPTAAGHALLHGRQWLPTTGGSDGFYYALLERVAP